MPRHLFKTLIMILAAIGSFVLAFAMFVTTGDVILRYFFNSPIKGVYEVIELLMGVLSPIAILYCSWCKAHVSVDLVFNALSAGAKKVTAIFALGCSLFVFAVLAWQGFYLIEEIVESNMCTPTLDLPMWPAAAAIFVSFLLVVPITVGEIVVELTGGSPSSAASSRQGHSEETSL